MTRATANRHGSDVSTGPRARTASSASCGSPFYGFGLIGAFVWFWQQADGLGEHAVGALKALVWPAFLVFEAFRALHG